MIYRAEIESNFVKVGNDFAQNAALSFGARGLMTFLLSLPEATRDGEQWQIWRTHIDEHAGEEEGKDVVSKYLRELEVLGSAILTKKRINGKVNDCYLFSQTAKDSWAKSCPKIHAAKSAAAKKAYQTQLEKGNCNLRNQRKTSKATAATDNAPTTEATPQPQQPQPQQAQPKEKKPQPKAAASQAAAPKTPDNSTELAEKLYNFAVRRRFNSSIPFEQSPTHREKLRELCALIKNELSTILPHEPTTEDICLNLTIMLQTVAFSQDTMDKFDSADKLKPAYILHSFATVWSVHLKKKPSVRQRFNLNFLQLPKDTAATPSMRAAYSKNFL